MAKSNDTSIHLISAHDGGNGYMKDAINGTRTVFPSVLAAVTPGTEGLQIDENNQDSVKGIIDHYLDNMDVTIQSKGVKNNDRYLVGKNASESGEPLITFNVSSVEGKSSSDISIICLLSLISYHALHDYYKKNNKLPQHLDVTVDKMITALPIDEFDSQEIRQIFSERFSKYSHAVIINNFFHPITVNIDFKKVKIFPEGAIAIFGLIGDINGYYRNDDLFKEFKQQNNLKDFNGNSITQYGNILGIDIGDGTVDFSVTDGMAPKPKFNSSILMGVGNVAERAVKALHKQYPVIGYVNRQRFMEIANRDNSKKSQVFRSFLNNQMKTLEQLISQRVRTIYSQLDGEINMVVISGGGAAALKDHYQQTLIQELEEISLFGAPPVLWVGKEYTQTLNLDGLQFMLSQV